MNLPSGDLARTGRCPGPGVGRRPRVRAELATPGRGTALPTVADGVAHLGDADGHVQAVDLATGAVLWRHRYGPKHDDGGPAASRVASLPAVAGGLLVVEAGGQVFVHDRRTGEVRWSVPGISSHHPVVVGDLLVVVHGLDAAAAYEVAGGAPRWRTEPDGYGLLGTFPAVAGGRLFLTEGSEIGDNPHGGLHAFDLTTGVRSWGFHDHFVGCDACKGDYLAFAPDHAVYARGLVWTPRNRYCEGVGYMVMELVGVDPATGADRTVLRPPDDEEAYRAAPVFGTDLVYCVMYRFGSRVALHALDPTDGRLVWERRFDGPVVGTPLLAGGILHLADGDRHLRAFDARTGDPLWELALDADRPREVPGPYGEVATPFTLAGGVLYAITGDGVLVLS